MRLPTSAHAPLAETAAFSFLEEQIALRKTCPWHCKAQEKIGVGENTS